MQSPLAKFFIFVPEKRLGFKQFLFHIPYDKDLFVLIFILHVSLAKLVNIVRYAYYISKFLSEETKYQIIAVSMALFFIPADISLKRY